MPINQPSNKKPLTNVAIARLNKGEKHFELACYPNKLFDYRNKIEENVAEVLQQKFIFASVKEGKLASNADIEQAWKKKPYEEETIIEQARKKKPYKKTIIEQAWEENPYKKMIIEDILRNGTYQVGGKERAAMLQRAKNVVIDFAASRLVDPKSMRLYTTGMIEKALDQLSSQAATHKKPKKAPGKANEETKKAEDVPMWTGVRIDNVKAQSLFAIRALIYHQPIPVARIQMKLRITIPVSTAKQTIKNQSKTPQTKDAEAEEKGPSTVEDEVLTYIDKVQNQETVGSEWQAVGLVNPEVYKTLNDFIEAHSKGQGKVEVLDEAVGVVLD
ncbi:hypothetical protein CC80DRAFT_180038 [Byssothecium circinans]|uniref:Shwachman-Bodian-diamond syndrome protein n=1 Tax=Byssothecium circinans TaxID=147558 RepID=A0A6A5TK73_9PLEO|nr:hypothetical protein CC80DRAFT_180038 [Byssothecium circinans]